MKVKNRMTSHPITARVDTTHREAKQIMELHNIRRLPVLDRQGKLVGIVSLSDLLEAGPSQATTLSVHEIYSLLDKLTLKQIMSAPVLAVDENCSLTGAARIMLENGIGSLVVMRGDEMVGIITETDIFKAFFEVMGGGQPGFRIDVDVPDEPGMLARIAEAITNSGGNIVSLATFQGEDAARGVVSIKERGADEARLRAAFDAIVGLRVLEFRASVQNQVLRIG
jgi:acetoin utilization protein AcuB